MARAGSRKGGKAREYWSVIRPGDDVNSIGRILNCPATLDDAVLDWLRESAAPPPELLVVTKWKRVHIKPRDDLWARDIARHVFVGLHNHCDARALAAPEPPPSVVEAAQRLVELAVKEFSAGGHVHRFTVDRSEVVNVKDWLASREDIS